MKLSIIVPFYNVEKYLYKCLKSILSSTVSAQEYEIIVIDDGSTDSSPAIVSGMEWGEINHKILSQSNSGQSVARNNGLHVAEGEYVWFVDSDDWIDSNSLEAILDCLNGCDVVSFASYYKVFEKGEELAIHKSKSGSGLDFCLNFGFHGIPYYIFRRQFLLEKHLSFVPGIVYEDSLFVPQAVSLASYVKIYEEPVYYHLLRAGSTMQSDFSLKKLNSYKTVISGLNNFCLSVVPNDYRNRWSSICSDVINGMARLASGTTDNSLKKKTALFLDDVSIVWPLRNSRSLFTRIWYYLGRLFGNRFFEVYQILSKVRYIK
jgi:Glycosyltransferases involved in cell wall biogenesis